MATPLYVGVDGGGTRTRAVVAGADLAPLGRGASGPANVASTPIARVVETVREAIDDALSTAAVPASEITLISCGLAGVDGTGSAARLRGALEAVYGSGRVHVTTDARIALAGALDGPPGSPGVVIIAGTGSIAFGLGPDGEEARAGGWGPLIGDEGSGYAIARAGLAAVVRYLDGRGPRTRMSEVLLSAEGTLSGLSFVQRLYRAGGGPADVAAYFPVVLDAARAGDDVALQILRDAAGELALAVRTVLLRLGLLSEPVSVATVGGVFAAGDLILAPLRAGLPKTVRLGPPAHAPELGAIKLAIAL